MPLGSPAPMTEFGSDGQPVQVDLRTPDGVEHVYQSTIDGGRTLVAAALNARVGQGDMQIVSTARCCSRRLSRGTPTSPPPR